VRKVFYIKSGTAA